MNPSPSRTCWQRARRLGFKLGLALTAVLLTLGALEVGLRLTQPGPPPSLSPQVEHVYVPCDPAAGRISDYWHMKPDQNAYHLDAPVSINSLGLRDANITRDKPADRYRLLALGDSHTFGFGVPEDQTWPRLLERRLRGSAKGKSVEIVNAGVQALAIEQEVQLLQDRLLALQPDLVVLAYYWNDMPIQGEPFEPWEVGKEMIPPTMTVKPRPTPSSPPAGTARESPSAGGVLSSLKELAKKSYLAYFVVQRLPVLQMALQPTVETKWKQAILAGKTSERIRASWNFVEKQLVKLRELSREHDFKLLVMVIPLFEQMTSDHFSAAAYQTELAAMTRRQQIAFCDPLPAIRAVKPSYPQFFIPFDGHPNGLIYTVIADSLAHYLEDQGLSP